MSCLLKEKKFECRVSSVLNRDVKMFGKKYMFDDSEETCWNSDQGTPQWIVIEFENECELSSFEIQFQGGFAGKDSCLEAGPDSKNLTLVQQFYPEDINPPQRFQLERKVKSRAFRLLFGQSTDFFGRIIIYKLNFYS